MLRLLYGLGIRLGLVLGFRDRVRVSVSVRVTLGFRDRVRVRVKVRVSYRIVNFMYSVWPPVSLRVRVSLGFRDRVRVSVCYGYFTV